MSDRKYDEFDTAKRRKFAHKTAEQFGIDTKDYDLFSYGHSKAGDNDKPQLADLEKDIADAMANDYDVRRSLEAAQMSGNKRAGELPKGVSNIAEAYDIHKFLKRTHSKKLGGNNFSSANDYASVTQHFVEKDREKMLDTLATKDDLTAMKEKLMKKATKNKHSGEDHPAVPSDRLAAAQERISGAAHDPTSLYDKNNDTAPRTDDQMDASRNFLDDYKMDVTKGANLRQDIKTNVGNASNTVTNVYGR